jgi:hypothetical protein
MKGNHQRRLEILESRVGQKTDEAAIRTQRAWATRVAHMRIAAEVAGEDLDKIEITPYPG